MNPRFIGILDSGDGTAIVQITLDKDCLSPDLLEYYGEYTLSKRVIAQYPNDFLKYAQAKFPDRHFSKVRFI